KRGERYSKPAATHAGRCGARCAKPSGMTGDGGTDAQLNGCVTSSSEVAPNRAHSAEHPIDVLPRTAVVDDAGSEPEAAAQIGAGKKGLAPQLEAIEHRAIDGRDRAFVLVIPSRHAKADDAQPGRRRELELR